MKRYCVIDTETGGVGAEAAQKYAIIQLGACIYYDGVLPGVDQSFECVVLDRLGEFQDEAMQVNGFTMDRIYREGVSPATAAMKFVLWLHKNFPVDERVTLMGHNVGYDVSFLQRLFRLADCLPMYDPIFNYRTIDTASIARFLIDAGAVPLQRNDSKGLFEHFECAPDKPHDALSDAIATGKLYYKMQSLVGKLVADSLIPPLILGGPILPCEDHPPFLPRDPQVIKRY